MVLKALYKELRRMYYSIFRPPSIDTALIRRERLSIVYAVSSFTLFVISTYMIFKNLQDPVVMEKATLKPRPESKRIKIEFDAKTFTFSKKTVENEAVDQEKNNS